MKRTVKLAVDLRILNIKLKERARNNFKKNSCQDNNETAKQPH
jgi:hypothetical protein